MTTITWKITQLDRKTTDGFVTTAHWTCAGVDGDYSASIYSTAAFDGDLSVPYERLNEAQVLGWVWEKVSKGATEDAVKALVAEQKAPSSATGLPWAV